MNFQSVSPYIRVAMDSLVQAPWTMAERMLWDYELLFLMEGHIAVTVGEQSYEGVSGDLFLFKPGERHTIRILGDKPLRQPHVHFDLSQREDSVDVKVSFKMIEDMNEQERGWFREDELSGKSANLPNYMRLRNPAELEKQLFAIIHEFESKPPLYEWSLKGRMLQLLAYVAREYEWSGRMVENTIQWELLSEVRSYIVSQACRELTLDELSERFHLSKPHLIRLFSRVFDTSPIQYHQRVRLERAQNMMIHTRLPVQEIADQLGFSGIHAFSRAFRNKFGISPASFRKHSHVAENSSIES